MKHYHGLSRADILRDPNAVGPCYRMIDTPEGKRRQYFCKLNNLQTKPMRNRSKRTRYKEPKASRVPQNTA